MERKEVIARIKEILKRSPDTHNEYTPLELCDEMIGKLPKLHKDMKILVMFNLEFIWVIREKIGKENLKNVWFLTSDELKRKAAIGIGINENNVIIYSYNIKQIEGEYRMPKFDVVVGNPPYNGVKKGKGDGAGKSIWAPFIEKAFNSLKEEGYMCVIHPSTWRYGKTKTLLPAQKILFSNQISYLKTQMPFPGVGTIVDYYVIQKKIATNNTTVVFLDITKEYKIYGNIRYINHYQSDIVNSIFSKVFKTQDNGLKCVWGWGGGWKNIDKSKPEQDYEWVKGPNKIIKFGYPHINHFDKKVIGRVSRKINAFYDNGNLGLGDHNYYLLVNNDIEGHFIETIWNSKLMLALQKFNSIYFWDDNSSFRNSDIPFKSIIPESAILMSDEDVFKHYNLTNEEIKFININIS